MELERARAIAEELKRLLEPACEKITIAGSIRRQKPDVGDIEILAIPKFDGMVDLLDRELKWLIGTRVLEYRPTINRSIIYGPKNKLLRHIKSSIGIDVFSTTEECWAVSLVVRTGGERTNKRIAYTAMKKGWRFRAYGDGFDTPDGHIRCSSEQEVFEAVGLPYLEPQERE